jgi:ABC-type dipeptide/oligopeptide/nickel transport system permease subunit
MDPFMPLAMATIGSAILVEAALSFLGPGALESYLYWDRTLSILAAE